jgi:hypothetical protein
LACGKWGCREALQEEEREHSEVMGVCEGKILTCDNDRVSIIEWKRLRKEVD